MSVPLEFTPFTLRAELEGHADDVRVVCVCELGILTGSRDKTIRLWTEDEHGRYSEAATFAGHTDFVTALAYLPGVTGAPGSIASGSRDTTVRVWDASDPNEPVQVLRGHGYQVTGVAWLGPGELISSSLDATLRLWHDSACVAELRGHTGPVLCTLSLPGGRVWSGSGDRTIRIWEGAQEKAIVTGHTDTVRHLAEVSGVGVVSASHDTTLRLWSGEGQPLGQLEGHLSLVYAVAAAADGARLCSGSEDDTLRVWDTAAVGSGQALLQTIKLPGCVWSVGWLPDGDIVSGGADGVLRLFTQDPLRAADAGATAVFEARLAAKVAEGQQGSDTQGQAGLPPGVSMEDPSALTQPGDRPGQTKVVSEAGTAIAYSWDADSAKWERIGEVVGGPSAAGDTLSSARDRVVDGRAWDFVFDVDVEDGAPARKLCVDAGENPYVAADRFLAAEGLPTSYREQIVQFILQNTAGAGGGGAGQGGGGDPFTGAHAYVPSAGPPPGLAKATPSAGAGPLVGGGADPYTGTRATAGGNTLSPATSSPSLSANPLAFDGPPDAALVLRKLRELQQDEGASSSSSGVADQAMEALAHAVCGTGVLTPADWSTLQSLLAWPLASLFPVLDLARQTVARSWGQLSGDDAAVFLGQFPGDMAGLAEPGDEPTVGAALARSLSPAAPPPARLLAARLAANLFACSDTQRWALGACPVLLAALATGVPADKKPARHALATTWLNAALALAGEWGPSSAPASMGPELLAAAADGLLATPADEREARRRCVLALSVLLRARPALRAGAKGLGLGEAAAHLAADRGAGDEESAALAAAAAELAGMLG